jgi:hypothetical protein
MLGRLGLAFLLVAVLTGTASAAATKQGDPQKHHNAADQAWAERMHIQRSDLGAGDWRVEADSGDHSLAPKDCKDPDLSDLVETGSAENPNFSRNGSFVGSGSSVFQTESQAAKAWSRISGQSWTRCLTVAMRQGLAGSGARLRIVSSGSIAMPKLAPRFKTTRIRLVVSGPAATIQGRIGVYLAAQGRAVAMVLVMSFGRPLRPISESMERRLATLVASRLKS